MRTLRDAGFEGIEAATGPAGERIAVGTLSNGQAVVVAKTSRGEGYVPYPSIEEAQGAFDEIVAGAGLTVIQREEMAFGG